VVSRQKEEATMAFVKIDATELKENVISLIRDRWPLLAAGTEDDFNFMTVNWGMVGELWFKDAVTVYVRHSRHTFKYMDTQPLFAISILKPGHEKALSIAGSKSGRDMNKVEATGLTPVFLDGSIAFEEAEYVIIAKRLFQADIDYNAIEDAAVITKAYANGDPHRMYIGEILSVYQQK
jgi:flavin reductase (DIM6/NTAB) family NADH-FMN oxidoreductase RutF